MEYKYSRELKHNYLIVKKEDGSAGTQQEKSEQYQIKMLETGSIKGFVPCEKRTINNEEFLYYEINSMQSIRDRFAARGMDMQQLSAFFECLKRALEGLGEYLLGMEKVVFDTRSIFVDLTTGEYKFMYCPYYSDESGFASFSDELFGLVDHDDEKAVEMVYDFCERAQMESCLAIDCIDMALEKLEEDEPVQPEPEKETFTMDFEPLSEEIQEEGVPQVKPEGNKARCIVQLIFGFLFVIVIGAMMFIRMNYILTDEENLLSVSVMGVCVISSLVAFLSGIKELMNFTKVTDKANTQDADTEDLFPPQPEFDVVDDSFKASDYKKPIYISDYNSSFDRNRRDDLRKSAKFEANCGETVLLDEGQSFDRPITLYSNNMEKTIRIPLEKLPVTIGKMEGCVDKVINDLSISRIHCRIARNSDGKLVLVDLNSTNGTFRNGLKLSPQVENCIEEGDEVRIGRICFDCR